MSDPNVVEEHAKVAKKLLDELRSQISDTRNQAYVTYPLHSTILIILLAREAGCFTARATVQYWGANLEFLMRTLHIHGLVPSCQTIRRLLTMIDAEEHLKYLMNTFVPHVRALHELEQKAREEEKNGGQARDISKLDVISCDGQMVRSRNGKKIGPEGEVKRKYCDTNIVQVHSSKYCMTLAQGLASDKRGEASVIKSLLPLLHVEGAIFSCDAASTHPATLKAVTDVGCDYNVVVKKNEPNLFESIEFAQQKVDRLLPPSEAEAVLAEHVDNSGKLKCSMRKLLKKLNEKARHGVIEYGEYEIPYWEIFYRQSGKLIHKVVTLMPAQMVVDRDGLEHWPELQMVVCINTTVRLWRQHRLQTKDVKPDPRFFLSSLALDVDDTDYCRKVMRVCLGRWSVETSHWQIDMCFDQDRLPLSNRNFIRNNTIVTKHAANVINHAKSVLPNLPGDRKISTAMLQQACQNAETAFNLLAGFISGDDSLITQDANLRSNGLYKEETVTYQELGPTDTTYADTALGQLAMAHKKGRRSRKKEQSA